MPSSERVVEAIEQVAEKLQAHLKEEVRSGAWQIARESYEILRQQLRTEVEGEVREALREKLEAVADDPDALDEWFRRAFSGLPFGACQGCGEHEMLPWVRDDDLPLCQGCYEEDTTGLRMYECKPAALTAATEEER